METKGPRGGKRYLCEICGGSFPLHEVQVDHVVPVIPVESRGISLSWNDIIDRIFHCDTQDLRVLCRPCHSKITKRQNNVRKTTR